jgi:D-serine deaminase-like pyridoxal phosphate-dependent protein
MQGANGSAFERGATTVTGDMRDMLGCSPDDLDTPFLSVDLELLDRNVATLVESCRQRGVDWRPHAKCHKSPRLAQRLLEAGAIGVTCAKLGEAEVMADGGIHDVLIANILAGPHKRQRLVELRRRSDPLICVDSFEQARPIAQAMQAAALSVRTLVEVDIGMRRVGVSPGPRAVELIRQLAELPGLKLCGVMGYEGHLLLLEDREQKRKQILAALDLLAQTRDDMLRLGLDCSIVSCGGTGSWPFSLEHAAVTELQAGGGIFMDEFYRRRCHVQGLQQALTIVTTVASRPATDRAVIDAGRKTMNQELHMPRVASAPGWEIVSLSAEHGALRPIDGQDAVDLRVGDRVEIVPGYGDFTTVLHDAFYVFRDRKLVEIWPLEARGKLH